MYVLRVRFLNNNIYGDRRLQLRDVVRGR